jgi:adenine/guanine phosphoribosyltransferase-like PRPP-binding protein
LAGRDATGEDRRVVAPLGRYEAKVGSQQLDLPIVPLSDGIAVALLITVDQGVHFSERAGQELAELLRPYDVEIVASLATMGIPVAIEVSRSLGLDDYVIFQKTPKIHLADALSEPLHSITTGQQQHLLFDSARVEVVKGRNVALIDDVISTGGSMRAALALLRRAGANPVAIGVLATEGEEWRSLIGEDAELMHSLGVLPLFESLPGGGIRELS